MVIFTEHNNGIGVIMVDECHKIGQKNLYLCVWMKFSVGGGGGCSKN